MVGHGYAGVWSQSLWMRRTSRFLATKGIHVCQGQIWVNTSIDSGDGDGICIAMPQGLLQKMPFCGKF